MPQRSQKIEIVPYDPNWPKQFEAVAERIQSALGKELVAIHHVGSTSVPGLAAKPKIDIIAEVRTLEFDHALLEEIGWRYRGGFNLPLRKSFTLRSPELDVNLYVFEQGDPEVELNLLFRDYLRDNKEERDAYAALKYKIIEKESAHQLAGIYKGYTLEKHDFIQSILKKTGFNRLRFVICTHHAEWDAAKRFRNQYFFAPNKMEDPYTWTFDHESHKHFILYKGTEIIGYAHVQLWPENRAAVRIVVIDEAYHRRGYGREFMRLIEKWLKLTSYHSLHAESSPNAVAFYRSIGYIDMPFNDPDGYEGGEEDTDVGKVL